MRPRPVFWRLIGDCLHWPGRLAALVVSLVLLAAARLYLTWLVKAWSDELLAPRAPVELPSVLARAGLVTAVIVVCVFVSQYLMSGVNFRLVESLRARAQARLMALGAPALRRRQSGDLLSRVFNDAASMQGFARDVLKRLLGEGIVLIGSLAMMFYLDWHLALATCAMVPLVAVVLAPFGWVIRRSAARAQRVLGTLTALFEEQLRGFTTVKGFQGEEVERRRFAETNADYRRRAMTGELWSSVLLAGVWLITGLGLLAILWYGSSQVSAGRLTPGALLAFCLYAVQTIEPLRHLSEAHTILQRGLAAASRIYEVIDDPAIEPASAMPVAAVGVGRVGGRLGFEGVDFAYEAGRPVLRALDLEIAAGEAVAVVAASGGGKSTLASLLVGHLKAGYGRIALDGIDVRELSLAELRRAVCVVEQEPFLFTASVRDNVRYGSWSAPSEKVEDAVRLAGLDSFVRSLPRGLDEPVREAGRNLSGGQKQRIALARAIVRDPAVLVLDEATSALDGEVEARIFAGLADWLARRTVLVMAHRLSTVKRFDRVVVLEGGRVAGDGPVDSLFGTCPSFRTLFAEQLTVAEPTPGDAPIRRIAGRVR